ncbi:MAG: hypothetical protein AWT59_1929 [Candidatus Gallionella acididurans]|uniref:Uncharacterized protein n=1 Tax=Candidatus Gallionella acididurans TaxID=1796491 RepID=A0A139BSR3_9PROT|nr:MAG: hypothetical protein AWT59_1929 [Candidatus Gallionella acididurans]
MIRNDVDGQLAVNANMARSANPAARLAGAAAMALCRSRFYGYLSPCKKPKNPELTMNWGPGDVDTRVKRIICALIQRVIVWGN